MPTTHYTIEKMTREELSLLLFLESCAVDQGGMIFAALMNEEDMAIAKSWNDTGFISFGRLPSSFITSAKNRGHFSMYVVLSKNAWECASAARMNRAIRNMHNLAKPYLLLNNPN